MQVTDAKSYKSYSGISGRGFDHLQRELIRQNLTYGIRGIGELSSTLRQGNNFNGDNDLARTSINVQPVELEREIFLMRISRANDANNRAEQEAAQKLGLERGLKNVTVYVDLEGQGEKVEVDYELLISALNDVEGIDTRQLTGTKLVEQIITNRNHICSEVEDGKLWRLEEQEIAGSDNLKLFTATAGSVVDHIRRDEHENDLWVPHGSKLSVPLRPNDRFKPLVYFKLEGKGTNVHGVPIPIIDKGTKLEAELIGENMESKFKGLIG